MLTAHWLLVEAPKWAVSAGWLSRPARRGADSSFAAWCRVLLRGLVQSRPSRLGAESSFAAWCRVVLCGLVQSWPLRHSAESSFVAWCFTAWCIVVLRGLVHLVVSLQIDASSGLFSPQLVHVVVSLSSVHLVVSSLLWHLHRLVHLVVSLQICASICLLVDWSVWESSLI